MANIGEYINRLAQSAGIAKDDKALVDFLSNSEVSKISIADEVAGKIEKSLLTFESAKNHPELKKHYTAQALNGVDSAIDTLADELGLDDTTKAEIKAETSSYKKVPIVAKKARDIAVKKIQEELDALKKSKGDPENFHKTINDLNAELANIKKTTISKSDYDTAISNHTNQMTELLLNDVFSSYNYALPASREANILTAKTLFRQALAEKGLRVVNDQNTLKLQTADGMDYFEANQKMDLKTLADKTVAAHKILKVSEKNTQQQQQHTVTNVNGKMAAALAEMEAQIAIL